jgi:redox-sensitive bicupin YhaK (pirin superfamily)
MSDILVVEKITEAQPMIEGAGVRLHRAFGNPRDAVRLDPFVLLDDFGSSNPEDYRAGFPMHPHRGMEAVTYMISGSVEHQDSTGTRGVVHAGEVQWMTAGSGIIHQEMPLSQQDAVRGLQLWVNLPAKQKMIAPKYRDVRKEMIPTYSPEDGVTIKVIAGKIEDTTGPVQDLAVKVEFLDIGMAPGKTLRRPIRRGDTAFAYVYNGSICFDAPCRQSAHNHNLVWFEQGDEVMMMTKGEGTRFILCSGPPLKEPIVWSGPVVVNTREELDQAFRELREGTFIKAKKPILA